MIEELIVPDKTEFLDELPDSVSFNGSIVRRYNFIGPFNLDIKLWGEYLSIAEEFVKKSLVKYFDQIESNYEDRLIGYFSIKNPLKKPFSSGPFDHPIFSTWRFSNIKYCDLEGVQKNFSELSNLVPNISNLSEKFSDVEEVQKIIKKREKRTGCPCCEDIIIPICYSHLRQVSKNLGGFSRIAFISDALSKNKNQNQNAIDLLENRLKVPIQERLNSAMYEFNSVYNKLPKK